MVINSRKQDDREEASVRAGEKIMCGFCPRKDVTTDPDTATIITSITTMARSLGIKTIAEGVETEEQWKVLRLLRCDMGQGYYFSPALKVDDFERFHGLKE
jgi:EAL domain-containing protein (putative c-di-GMP-specific phosphodiesterase class I)